MGFPTVPPTCLYDVRFRKTLFCLYLWKRKSDRVVSGTVGKGKVKLCLTEATSSHIFVNNIPPECVQELIGTYPRVSIYPTETCSRWRYVS